MNRNEVMKAAGLFAAGAVSTYLFISYGKKGEVPLAQPEAEEPVRKMDAFDHAEQWVNNAHKVFTSQETVDLFQSGTDFLSKLKSLSGIIKDIENR